MFLSVRLHPIIKNYGMECRESWVVSREDVKGSGDVIWDGAFQFLGFWFAKILFFVRFVFCGVKIFGILSEVV